MSSTVLLSLGSNTNNPEVQLARAVQQLRNLDESAVVAVSSNYITPPWGNTDQSDFLNLAVLLTTNSNVVQLMENILSIEKNMGRVRMEKWGPRIIDIDIILFGDVVSTDDFAVVPHPYMEVRRFVLAPSAEIAGDMVHPVSGKTISELLAVCPDSSVVLPTK